MASLSLGAFRLIAPLARGAMGEVWRGVHDATGLPVAVKVLPAEMAADVATRRQLTQEIRAVAGLDHPHIIAVLDAGATSAEASAASDGRMKEGAPWVAMELASGGSLREHRPSDFAQLKAALEEMLDALAHAHGRGLVHRDLKPANLLYGARRDARPGLKITDFGLAMAMDETLVGDASAGTPAYMAPEQLLGQAHEVGPWTDLYAVGCVGWWAATGRAPFARDTTLATARATLSDELPPFVPRFGCPPELEDWLRVLLQRAPGQRPRRAADALAALRPIEELLLGDLDEEDEQTASFGRPVVSPDEPTQHGFDFDEELLDAPLAGVGDAVPSSVIGPPPTCAPWQQANLARPAALVGAGIGLLAAREPPLAGRSMAQQALWEELTLVHSTRSARGVLVSGEAGVGKTALVRWLVTRADEVGAARSWGLRDEPRALEASVVRWLRLREVHGVERAKVVGERLGDADQAAAVMALLDGRLSRQGRQGVVKRLLSQASVERPLVWWVDDAHRHPEALRIAHELLDTELPVLVVLVVAHEELGERDAASLWLDHLDLRTVELSPLPMPARRQLLDGLLGLEPSLSEAVAARSGHPAWLVQLVRSWAQRGALVPSARGLRLADGVPLEVPEDLQHTWLRRVEEVLEQLEPAAGWDLHVAAALGRTFEEATWHTACDDPEGEGLGWSDDGLARRQLLVQSLVDAGLLRGRRRLRFAHGMLHQALVDEARRTGKEPWLHHACAAALQLHGVDDAARMGRHLLRAGHPTDAIGPLLEGVAQRVGRRPGAALQVLLIAEEAANHAALPPTDPVSGALLVTRAEVHLALGEPKEALRWSRWAQQAVQTHGVEVVEHWDAWHRHQVRALWVEHDAFLALEVPDEALATVERLEPAVRRVAAGDGLGAVWLARARLLARSPGRRRHAAELLVDALRIVDDQPDDKARVYLELARLYAMGDRRPDASSMVDAGLAAVTAGEPGLRGDLLALRGELALLDDDDDALGQLERALAALEAVGRTAPRVQLLAAACDVDRGGRGLLMARRIAADLGPAAHERRLAALVVALGEARVRRWAAVQEQLQGLGATVDAVERWAADQLAEVARSSGFPQLAERVEALRRSSLGAAG